MLRVVKYGEGVLKRRAEEIEVFDEELKTFSKELFDSLIEEKGLGLAAPQVGVSKRVFVIDMRQRCDTETPVNFTLDSQKVPLDLCMPLFAVNPEWEPIGDLVEEAEEGCLSFPGIYAKVDRAYKVRLKYLDLDGKPHEIICDGLFARCVQHESDHLDGVCFVDRLTSARLFKISPKLRKLRRQTKEFLKSQPKK